MNIITNKLASMTFIRSLESSLALFFIIILVLVGHPTFTFAEDSIGTGAILILANNQKGVEMLSSETLLKIERAAKIDAFMSQEKWGKPLPLAGYGMAMVRAAERHGVDWRLIPSIGFVETSGGRYMCADWNAFGWDSCKKHFDSFEDAFDYLAWNLGGHNPKTARYYAGKSIEQILVMYNPPHVEGITPGYHNKIAKTMNDIERQSVS